MVANSILQPLSAFNYFDEVSQLNLRAGSRREILVLRDYLDLSYEELAGILSIPVGTVMSRLHAARKRLRFAYLDKGGTESV